MAGRGQVKLKKDRSIGNTKAASTCMKKGKCSMEFNVMILIVAKAQLHQLVQDKDKDPEGDQIYPQTEEEILVHVLGAKSGYILGKGNGYRGSTKTRLQEEKQLIMRKQQDQVTHLKSKLEASKKDMDEYKEEQKRIIAEMEKRFM